MNPAGRKLFCYSYTRVSTLKQASEGVSIDTQKRLINDWVAKEKAILLDSVADEGYSGKLKYKQRPGLKKIVGLLKPGNLLLTTSLTRVGRVMTDVIRLVDKLLARNIYIIFIQEGLDSRREDHRTAIKLMALISELQLKNIVDATQASMNKMKEKGMHVGAVPYGWKKISSDKGSGLEEDPFQQETIKLIRTMRNTITDDGIPTPITNIVNCLNNLKIPPPRSDKWSYNTVNNIYNRDEVRVLGRRQQIKHTNKKVPL